MEEYVDRKLRRAKLALAKVALGLAWGALASAVLAGQAEHGCLLSFALYIASVAALGELAARRGTVKGRGEAHWVGLVPSLAAFFVGLVLGG